MVQIYGKLGEERWEIGGILVFIFSLLTYKKDG
jgi:hypothetical protein